jgi:hypothetical protein
MLVQLVIYRSTYDLNDENCSLDSSQELTHLKRLVPVQAMQLWSRS